MSDDVEFAQFIAQATADLPAEPTAKPPVEVKPPEDKPAEPKTPEVAAETKTEVKTEPKPEDKPAVEAAEDEPAWKKLVAAEKAKREARRAALQQQTPDAALKSKLDEVTAKLAKYEALERKKETDPLGALEDFGIPYDRATKEYIKTLDKNPDKTAPEIQTLSQKIQQLETALDRQREEIERRSQSEAINQFNADVSRVLEAKGSDFELVRKHPRGAELVREQVAKHYRETATFDASGKLVAPGEIMATEEACARAEGELDEFLGNFKGTRKFVTPEVKAKTDEQKPKASALTISQDMRQGGTKTEPHGDEIEQLLLLKKTLEAQLNVNQGN